MVADRGVALRLMFAGGASTAAGPFITALVREIHARCGERVEFLLTTNASGIDQIISDAHRAVELPVSFEVLPAGDRARTARRVDMVRRADAVVTCAGEHGVPEIVAIARALDRRVIPLPFGRSGNTSQRLWTDARDELRADASGRELGLGASAIWAAEARAAWPRSSAAEDWAVHDWATLVIGVASRRCFIAMPHGDRATSAVADRIDELVRDCGFEPLRQSNERLPGPICDSMWSQIRASDVMVALLTDDRYSQHTGGSALESANPNVIFEAGAAEAMGIPVIYVVRGVAPFDVAQHRSVLWGDGAGHRDALVRDLRRMLLATRGADWAVSTTGSSRSAPV